MGKGINGKNKGNTMERLVAKKLTDWSGHDFNRTPQSGGLHWTEDNSVAGDIVAPPDLQFPFSIEIKKREVPWEFDFMLTGTSSIWEFYKQCVRDSCRVSGNLKEPLVVFSKNRRRVYAMVHKDVYDILLKGKELRFIEIGFSEYCHTVIVDFDAMLSVLTLEEVLSLNKTL